MRAIAIVLLFVSIGCDVNVNTERTGEGIARSFDADHHDFHYIGRFEMTRYFEIDGHLHMATSGKYEHPEHYAEMCRLCREGEE